MTEAPDATENKGLFENQAALGAAEKNFSSGMQQQKMQKIPHKSASYL